MYKFRQARSNVSIKKADIDKDLRCALCFEYHIFNKLMYIKLNNYIFDGNICSQEFLFKAAIHELKHSIPTFVKFWSAALTLPVSEAFYKTWGSISDQINKQRLKSEGGNGEVPWKNDKRVSILIYIPTSSYRNTRIFFFF